MKRIAYTHAVLLWALLSAGAVMVSGCPEAEEIIRQAVRPPEVSVRNVAVRGISRESLDLELGIEIDNPNPVGLSLAGVDYNFVLSGHRLASGTGGGGIELEPSGVSEAVLPLSLDFEEVKSVYEASRGRDEIPYELSGKVQVDTPIGRIPVPYKARGELPVIRPPRIRSVRVEVDKLSFSGAELVLSLNLHNPNSFPLSIQGADYSLSLDGRPFTSGSLGSGEVPPRSTGDLEVPVSLDFLSAGSWAYSLISGGSADYSLDYSGTYLIKGRPVSHSEQKSGSLSFGR